MHQDPMYENLIPRTDFTEAEIRKMIREEIQKYQKTKVKQGWKWVTRD